MSKLVVYNDQSIYREYCKNNRANIRLFAQPWYLDAACNGSDKWNALTVEIGGGIVGTFPYYKEGKKVVSIHNPQLTPRLGLYIDTSKCSDIFSVYNLQEEITKAVVSELPTFDKFEVAFDSRFVNWQGFYESGFCQTTYYSYVVYHDELNVDIIHNLFHGNQRRCVNKAIEKGLKIVPLSLDEFWEFQQQSFAKRQRENSISKEKYYRIANALVNNNAGRIRGALNENGEILCTLFLFLDDQRCYEVLTSYDPSRKPDCRPLLTEDGMMFARDTERDYDFEGSMIPGVSKYNSAFNAHKEPYMVITKYSDKYLNKKKIKEGIKAGLKVIRF